VKNLTLAVLALVMLMVAFTATFAQSGVPEGGSQDRLDLLPKVEKMSGQAEAPPRVPSPATPIQPSELEQLRGEVLRLKEQAFQLRHENAQLRAAVAEVRAAYDTVTLTAEQQGIARDKEAYVEKMRAVLKPGKDDVFDWTTLTFKPKPKDGGGPE
jgi:hypothetical protein